MAFPNVSVPNMPNGNFPNIMQQGGSPSQVMVLVPIQDDRVVNNYLVGNGNTVAFINFTSMTLWIKETSLSGIPQPIRRFNINEVIEQAAQNIPANLVTREEFDNLSNSFNVLSNSINKLIEDLGGKKE